MSMVYDEAGNLVELKVQRSGTCSVGTSSFCAQRYRYDWDEVGQLQRARRWDYVSTIPATEAIYPAVPAAAPAQDLNFAYSLGKRVRKTSAVSAQNTLEVFDTLRLSGSFYRNGDYDNEAVNVTGYLAILAIRTDLASPAKEALGARYAHGPLAERQPERAGAGPVARQVDQVLSDGVGQRVDDLADDVVRLDEQCGAGGVRVPKFSQRLHRWLSALASSLCKCS
jgi:hypothetical protein